MISFLRRLRTPRGWPVPVARAEGFAVAGELWPTYIPFLAPMRHADAEAARRYRDAMAWPDWMREHLRRGAR